MFGLFRYKGLFDNATSGMFGLATLKNDPNCVLIRDPSVLTSMYIDRAGTTLVSGAGDVVGKMLDLSGEGNHSVAPSDAARPALKIDANGKYYLERDFVDDNLPITWPVNLTTTGVIYTSTGDYTTKDYGVTLSGATNYTTPKYEYGLIVMASESKYDAKIIKYLDAKRGRSYLLGPELVTSLDLTAAGWSTLGGVSARTTNTLTTTSTGGLTNTTIMSGNKTYLVQLGFSKTGSSSLSVRLYSGGPDVLLSASSTGVISGVGNTATNDEFYLRLSGADSVTVTSLSVREVIIT